MADQIIRATDAQGQESRYAYPSSIPKDQIDTELKGLGLQRVQSWSDWATEKFLPDRPIGTGEALARTAVGTPVVAAAKVADWWTNSSTLEKALVLGTIPLGGPEIGLGIKLGGALAREGLPLAIRGLAGAYRVAKAGAIGGTVGGLTEDQGGIKKGVVEGLETALLGEGGTALANVLSRRIVNGWFRAFEEPTQRDAFLTKWVPELKAAGDNAEQRLRAAWGGQLDLIKSKAMTDAKAAAAKLSKQDIVVSPELTRELSRLRMAEYPPEPHFHTYSISDALEADSMLGRLSTSKEGELIKGTSPAQLDSTRAVLNGQLKGAMGETAHANWEAGQAKYALVSEVQRLLKGGTSFNDIRNTIQERYAFNRKAQQFLGDAYNDLTQMVHAGPTPHITRQAGDEMPYIYAHARGLGARIKDIADFAVPQRELGARELAPGLLTPAAGLAVPHLSSMVQGRIPTTGFEQPAQEQ